MARIAALCVVALLGCESGNDARSPCSNGPEHTSSSEFPVRLGDVGLKPECVPRCNAESFPHHNLATVPSGACQVKDEECIMPLRQGCPIDGGFTQGAIHGLVCRCRSGTWACEIYNLGGGVCRDSGDAGR